jgi:uncharacterized protein (DUF1778 family)
MAATRSSNDPRGRVRKAPKSRTLIVRLDEESRAILDRAAELRRISVSDYVRTVTVPQARREVGAARDQIIALSPEEQRAFWMALSQEPELTESQRELGAIMRGEA